MKKIIALVAVLFGVALLAGCGSSSGGVQTADPQTFLSTAKQPGVVTIDVRTPPEYAAGHVDGAINIDVEAPTFDSEIAKLDKNTTYTVYCHSGRRSGIATDAMSKAGFTHVIDLQGGFPDLVNAGAAVVTS
ncbi:MAG TPA: rhodanese-like domain-containing protein [Candidatus Angelobacter sp.]|nr:rhodanese-like domain-containing protein [Candidatus Angelobacter sp.]